MARIALTLSAPFLNQIILTNQEKGLVPAMCRNSLDPEKLVLRTWGSPDECPANEMQNLNIHYEVDLLLSIGPV